MPNDDTSTWGVNRGTEDERRRQPRMEREEWLTALVKTAGKMRKDDAYGKMRRVWGGIASRTFNDYVFAVVSSEDLYIESNGSGTWLYSPKEWAEKAKTEPKGRKA